MNSTNCSECYYLWRIYASATHRHVTAIRAADAAAEKHPGAIYSFEDSIVQLDLERCRTRQAIEHHQQSAHPTAEIESAKELDSLLLT